MAKKDKITISASLDKLSAYLAPRKGLIPMIGMGLIIINLILQLFFIDSWLAQSNLFLHIGLLASIFGLMLAWAL
ncbi:MAG TPA: hypothetical protein EYP74_03785 [Anaerolineales bacterium]|nr:hypothetical protein [Anaerolineales bacterium]